MFEKSLQRFGRLFLFSTACSTVLKFSQRETRGGGLGKDLNSVTRILKGFIICLSMAHFTAVALGSLATNGSERSS